MAKRKKQKTYKRWLGRGFIIFTLFIFVTFTAKLAIDPIGRYLIAKHSPTLAESLPDDELKWNLWSGVYIKKLKLKKVSPVFSEISLSKVWVNISYISLLFDQLSIDAITVEEVILKSKYSDKKTIQQINQQGSKLILKEFHPFLDQSEIKVLRIRVDAFKARKIAVLDRVNINLEASSKNLNTQGSIQLATLLGLDVRDIKFDIDFSPQGVHLKLNQADWKGAKIQLTSELKTRKGRVLHDSKLSFKSLALKSGTDLIYDQHFSFNPKVQGKVNLKGPLYQWKKWNGSGNMTLNSFTLKNMSFQKSGLIKQQLPSMTEVAVKKIALPELSLKSGKISWNKLQLDAGGLVIEAKGNLDHLGRFKLNGIAKLDQKTFEELPSMAQSAFDLIDSLHQVPIRVRGNFQNQEITNLSSIMRNAVGNQFQAIGSGLRQLFGR